MTSSWRYILGFLALVAATVWLGVLAFPDPKLHLIACDVGQGDAILASYGTNQVLIDGGPGNRVLDCLARHLPFWDREIELVILTHPQTDHFNGLIEVFRRYHVGAFLATPIDSSTQGYQVLKSTVGGSGIKVINPTRGMVIRLGMIYLEIVHPSTEFLGENFNNNATIEQSNNRDILGAYTSSRDPNDFSIVAILRLEEFEALLTGDIGPEVADIIAEELVVSDSRTIEYIKIPHHGSKNGLTSELLVASKPEIAVISVGKNPWGHPHQEVLKLLKDEGIKTLRTDEMGDIEIITDGSKWWLAD